MSSEQHEPDMRLYRLLLAPSPSPDQGQGQGGEFPLEPNFPNRRAQDMHVEDIEATKHPRDANFYGFHRAWNRPVKLWDPSSGHHSLASFGGQFDVSGNNTDTLLLDLETLEWSVVASHRNNTGLPASQATGITAGVGNMPGTRNSAQSSSLMVVPDGRIAHSTISRRPLDCGDRSTRHVVLDHRHTRMVIFGGFDGNNFLSDTWEFDMESRQWTCADKGSGSINTVGVGAAAAAAAQAATVAAQQQVNGSSGVGGDATRPAARCSHTCVATSDGNKMILFGGWQGDSSSRFNDVWVFHFGLRRWERFYCQFNSPRPSPR